MPSTRAKISKLYQDNTYVLAIKESGPNNPLPNGVDFLVGTPFFERYYTTYDRNGDVPRVGITETVNTLMQVRDCAPPPQRIPLTLASWLSSDLPLAQCTTHHCPLGLVR